MHRFFETWTKTKITKIFINFVGKSMKYAWMSWLSMFYKKSLSDVPII